MDTTEITKGARMSAEERTELAKDLRVRYDAGATVAQLSEETGRAFGTVHRLLKETGTLRPRGGNTRGKKD